MKQYKVNINGKDFEVAVEETTFGARTVSAPVPVAAKPAAAPAPQAQTANVLSASSSDGVKVTAPMPGTVLKIKAADGASVKKGDPIIVLEAMKMENEIAAIADGRVTVCVAEGAKVNSGDVIATIA